MSFTSKGLKISFGGREKKNPHFIGKVDMYLFISRETLFYTVEAQYLLEGVKE